MGCLDTPFCIYSVYGSRPFVPAPGRCTAHPGGASGGQDPMTRRSASSRAMIAGSSPASGADASPASAPSWRLPGQPETAGPDSTIISRQSRCHRHTLRSVPRRHRPPPPSAAFWPGIGSPSSMTGRHLRPSCGPASARYGNRRPATCGGKSAGWHAHSDRALPVFCRRWRGYASDRTKERPSGWLRNGASARRSGDPRCHAPCPPVPEPGRRLMPRRPLTGRNGLLTVHPYTGRGRRPLLCCALHRAGPVPQDGADRA